MKVIKINQIAQEELQDIHLICNTDFIPMLSERVDIKLYCEKLLQNAELISISIDSALAGVLALYCNDKEARVSFISSVCIYPQYRGLHLADLLLDSAIEVSSSSGMNKIRLEVGNENLKAISLYKKHGFSIISNNIATSYMEKQII